MSAKATKLLAFLVQWKVPQKVFKGKKIETNFRVLLRGDEKDEIT